MFLEYYGLKEQPFGDTPDPRFLYPAPKHRESLEGILRGIAGGLPVQAFTASPGLGKTTLTFALLERLDANTRVVRIFQTQCTAVEFLGFTLNGLGEPWRGGTADQAIARIQQCLTACSERSESVLLIVDEAHNLRTDALEVVERLSSSTAVKVLLVGHPELAHKLARSPRLQPPPFGVHSLRSLMEDEVCSYIAHRLAVAGCAGNALFTPAATAAIARRSRGIPREINSLCSVALIRGSARQTRPIDATDVESLAEGSISMSAYLASSLAAARLPHDPPAPSSETAKDTIEADIAPLIRQWLGNRRFWTGTAGEILAELARFPGSEAGSRVSPDRLISELQASSPALLAMGFAMDLRKRPGYPRLLSFHAVTPAEQVAPETPRCAGKVQSESPSGPVAASSRPAAEEDPVQNYAGAVVAAVPMQSAAVAGQSRQTSTEKVLPSLLAAVEEQRHDGDKRQVGRGVALLLAICGLAIALIYFPGTRRLHLFAKPTAGTPAAHAAKPDDAMADLNRQAQKGDVAAQIALAEHYRDGVGVPRNRQAALRWYEQAASQGDPAAQYEIGTELASGGEGIQPDPVAAYAWLVLAGANGHPLSQPALNALGPRLSPEDLLSVRFRLGEMYEHGIGTASDFVVADTWLMLGEAGGDPRCRQERIGLEGHMSKQQIVQAHARAEDWIRRHTPPSPTNIARRSSH